ncbi:MAG TPA: selenocysteine-specific translation elongation factor, partial [Kofleriaceae bacterium]|nr:selenocysteine-specific translation elongation factor [Kofleriaceae bacterium]
MTAHPLVVGTAGHIDHGKTALVHALTGIDTDRLPVEKARGITTELGFAHLELPPFAPSEVAGRVAVVDVPGHERFIKSMVAGAVGIDLVLLVIAADEGVMPQTREHLDICQLLGVRRGIVVISKRDLVDDDWLALVTDELRAFTAHTFLAGAPIVAVSAKTGAGLADLKATIARELAALPPRPTAGAFRLPLDRVFTLKGFGTVVTGTIASGSVKNGDELVALPRGLAARVRGVQIHGAAVDDAGAGFRCALNLGGVSIDELVRGDVLAHPGAIAPSHILDVRFRLLPAARALGKRSRVILHHGTAQVMASLVLVDRDTLAPGGETIAQLRVDARTPIAALPGDRFIVRGTVALAHHGTTLGGGEIVRVLASKARGAARDAHADHVRRLADARLSDRIALEAKSAGAAGIDLTAVAHRTGQTPADVAPIVDALVAEGTLLRAGDHAIHVHATVVAALEAKLRALVEAAESSSREELRTKLSPALARPAYDAIVDALARRGAIIATADQLAKPSPKASLSPDELALLDRFKAWALEPLRPKEIGAPAALDRLLAAKLVTKVKPDLYVETGALDSLRARLIAHLDAHAEITPQQWKDLCGTSRKFSIPLAEFFDAEKLTLRVGDIRRKRGR